MLSKFEEFNKCDRKPINEPEEDSFAPMDEDDAPNRKAIQKELARIATALERIANTLEHHSDDGK
ncbi:MAG: hypothetical protein IJ220_02050 [Clostridia bacterium]|nr:hypothetical protein [Clostridia bacterium]